MVYRNSDIQFTSSISYAGNITASVWAMSSGSGDYHWNDTSEKYEYRAGKWNLSGRDIAFTNSSSYDDCVNFTPCAPSVVCFSPNSEQFKNSEKIENQKNQGNSEKFGTFKQVQKIEKNSKLRNIQNIQINFRKFRKVQINKKFRQYQKNQKSSTHSTVRKVQNMQQIQTIS